jgi:hypothetical protein
MLSSRVAKSSGWIWLFVIPQQKERKEIPAELS